jgi:hypothetical protein
LNTFKATGVLFGSWNNEQRDSAGETATLIYDTVDGIWALLAEQSHSG